jgi:tungstate transport system substrate-binding protein
MYASGSFHFIMSYSQEVNSMKKVLLLVTLLIFAFSFAASAEDRLKMSSTTSTQNSGLFDVLIPPFEKANDVKVDVIAVGTGKAIKLGENGDVDLIFVHAKAAEDKFVADGFGVKRFPVMHNDFVIIGPPEDPAKLKGSKTAAEAFKKLAEGKAEFISRGDDSGTHKKEKGLWKAAGVKPDGKWYIEAGQGMGAVLTMAFNKKAYALTDRGTFIKYEDKIKPSTIVFEGDEALFNPYGVIAVNPEKHEKTKIELAQKFIDYVTGADGQKIIGDYKVKGKQLFYPDVVK